ncbi:hypothetical protein TNCV_2139691 [Trichonephila clavipes]|uniref:DUF4817 domain-containing protein n=1 Tax=Trichonephila clavipes TaxID=2585209 RepID=A0A8X6RRS5_TRICX|nr:hypothetical protein TNCV_2139691 [Trichonephila clavipes]
MNKESTIVALRKFRLQKNVKTGKGPSTVARLIKLVPQFEEAGLIKNRVRSGRPSIRIISRRCKFTWPPRSPDLTPVNFWQTATAGSDVVQSECSIFDDFFQHLWPYIGNNTANVVFQMVKRLWLIRIDQ